ncbi:serine/threonine-protein kinase tricorner isoform X6 [Vespula maculifrons]|uniref:Serine/threonine-protein kinase tricorner isoform X6 n=1 Tax=Vespula maculifrons TaxID=7453 RepID=A0ABD2CP27_VESMC
MYRMYSKEPAYPERGQHTVTDLEYPCEEATEVETHHQQTAATTMGVAEDDTPSSLTSHPNLNTNNPGQEDNIRINLSIFINAAHFVRSIKKRVYSKKYLDGLVLNLLKLSNYNRN